MGSVVPGQSALPQRGGASRSHSAVRASWLPATFPGPPEGGSGSSTPMCLFLLLCPWPTTCREVPARPSASSVIPEQNSVGPPSDQLQQLLLTSPGSVQWQWRRVATGGPPVKSSFTLGPDPKAPPPLSESSLRRLPGLGGALRAAPGGLGQAREPLNQQECHPEQQAGLPGPGGPPQSPRGPGEGLHTVRYPLALLGHEHTLLLGPGGRAPCRRQASSNCCPNSEASATTGLREGGGAAEDSGPQEHGCCRSQRGRGGWGWRGDGSTEGSSEVHGVGSGQAQPIQSPRGQPQAAGGLILLVS